ncbi:YcjX family protein [Halotalea alkalilenta]|uniref:YcjX family protein n=1 Tax=Halotalea alkalilenta TaxID=376489 RepID=UPI00047F473F|nr:YcjX family protein [Halotalea alkalilenta]
MALTLPRDMGDMIERGFDRRLRLAVTGLSRAGKTAFLTSLVNQLRHAGLDARLDLMKTAREGRLLGAQRIEQSDLSIPSFPYDEAIEALSLSPPEWPRPTRGISELCLSIRYRTALPGRALIKAQRTLTLDLVDYPGEWLLDLPLLELDYPQWCERMTRLQGPARRAYAADWLSAVQKLAVDQSVDDRELAELAAGYAETLKRARAEGGFSYVQPGRFLLPGDLEGAPVLQFFPLPGITAEDRVRLSRLPAGSLYKTLERRFEHYKRHVVLPFYRDHFRRFDRQVVLVDVLSALNAGAEVFNDMRMTLGDLMKSFRFGGNGTLRRLFSPRIDRLLICATKADHVTPEQHPKLLALLEQLLDEPIKDLRYLDVPVKALSLASIRATETRTIERNGQRQPVLYGTPLDEPGDQPALIFPGEVPDRLPEEAFWHRQGFSFSAFRPLPHRDALPHIRMDAALDWLLGDKLR